MEQVVIQFILVTLQNALEKAIEDGIKYIIRKVVDETGKCITQIVYQYDSDGDGQNDAEEVLYSLDTMIPDLSDGYCLCNKEDEIGVGYPSIQLVPADEFENWYLEQPQHESLLVTGNDDGYLIDYDGDGERDDVLVPLPFDYDGDGRNDWGWLLDKDNDNLPDVSPDSPFYPIGSPEYEQITKSAVTDIYVMTSDGCLTAYTESGQLKTDVMDTAYQIWVSEHGIMNKPLDMYTVTEGLLLIGGVVCAIGFVFKCFKRRKVM